MRLIKRLLVHLTTAWCCCRHQRPSQSWHPRDMVTWKLLTIMITNPTSCSRKFLASYLLSLDKVQDACVWHHEYKALKTSLSDPGQALRYWDEQARKSECLKWTLRLFFMLRVTTDILWNYLDCVLSSKMGVIWNLKLHWVSPRNKSDITHNVLIAVPDT